MSKRTTRMEGVIPSLIIPFRGETLDADALVRDLEFLNRSGVHGLAIGGGIGELVGRTAEETADVCRLVKRSSSLPFGVILLPDSYPELDDLLDAVSLEGPDVIFVGQPHYLFQSSAEDLIALFQHVCSRVSQPVFLANVLPSAMISAATVELLRRNNVVDGLLQGGIDPHIVVDTLPLRESVPVLCGVDDLAFVALTLGVDGILSTLAAVFPRQVVKLYNDVRAGDFESARRQHESLARMWRFLDDSTEGPARLHCAVKAQGRPLGETFAPFNVQRPSMLAEVRVALEREALSAKSNGAN